MFEQQQNVGLRFGKEHIKYEGVQYVMKTHS